MRSPLRLAAPQKHLSGMFANWFEHQMKGAIECQMKGAIEYQMKGAIEYQMKSEMQQLFLVVKFLVLQP